MHYDPDEISSPAADRNAIRAALPYAAAEHLNVEHWDIESTFLHELLVPENTLYVHKPSRFDGIKK